MPNDGSTCDRSGTAPSRRRNIASSIQYAGKMNRLKDKRALITGGTTGIGLETARLFLSEGARLAITGRNPATLEAARRELGADVLIIPSDASEVAAQKAGCRNASSSIQRTRYFVPQRWDRGVETAGAVGRAGLRSLLRDQRERALFSNSGAVADPREPRVGCAQRVRQRAHWHAQHEPLRSHKGCAAFARADPVRGAHLARHSRECDQPWPDLDTSLWQARPFGSRSQDSGCFRPKPGFPPAASETQGKSPMRSSFLPRSTGNGQSLTNASYRRRRRANAGRQRPNWNLGGKPDSTRLLSRNH